MPRFEDHEIDQLTVSDGKIRFINSCAEYMTTPEVRVTSKESFVEHDRSTDVTYTFRLNCEPDWVWLDIFQRVRGAEGVKINRDNLYIRCIPANLDGRYQTTKDAVGQTNRLYAEHKALLTDNVAALDVERKERAKAQSDRTSTVGHQFGKLQL